MIHKFNKFLSFLIVIALLFPHFSNIYTQSILTVYAIDIQTNEECIADANYEESYFNLYEAIYSTAGDWWTAKNIDGCKSNFFHIAIQNYLIKKYPGVFEKEIQVYYTQPVLNPVTNKITNYGSVDLIKSKEGDNVKFVWEIKPASYLEFERRKLAEQQLANYTNTEIHIYKDVQYVNGGIDPLIAVG